MNPPADGYPRYGGAPIPTKVSGAPSVALGHHATPRPTVCQETDQARAFQFHARIYQLQSPSPASRQPVQKRWADALEKSAAIKPVLLLPTLIHCHVFYNQGVVFHHVATFPDTHR
jgi:hypothetical protein